MWSNLDTYLQESADGREQVLSIDGPGSSAAELPLLILAAMTPRAWCPFNCRSSKGIQSERGQHPILNNMSSIVSPPVSAPTSNYQDYVNPHWVTLLNLLGMNVECERCLGGELFAKDGRRFLDFLSGYCVHNAGHNHPNIIQALKDEMDSGGPAMLQSHAPEIAGDLARRLCELAGGKLEKVFFGGASRARATGPARAAARPRVSRQAGPRTGGHRHGEKCAAWAY
jgi:ornithine--oxo-acid transaminase